MFDTEEDIVTAVDRTVIILSSCVYSLAYDTELTLYIESVGKKKRKKTQKETCEADELQTNLSLCVPSCE